MLPFHFHRKGAVTTKSPRPPRRAAVTLTTAAGSNTKYCELLKEARAVKLYEIGITDIRIEGRLSQEK